MGYTHYWTHKKEFNPTRWKQIIKDVRKIIKVSGVPLAKDYDEPDTKPQLDDDTIWFNGIGDDGHETFLINRTGDGEDAFCKTAQKPYDVVVTAVLTYLNNNYSDSFTVSSDGDGEDWIPGVELARRALPDRHFHIPAAVVDTEEE